MSARPGAGGLIVVTGPAPAPCAARAPGHDDRCPDCQACTACVGCGCDTAAARAWPRPRNVDEQCRAYWGSHGCGKRRGHAEPAHVCGVGDPEGLCSTHDGIGCRFYLDADGLEPDGPLLPTLLHGADTPWARELCPRCGRGELAGHTTGDLHCWRCPGVALPAAARTEYNATMTSTDWQPGDPVYPRPADGDVAVTCTTCGTRWTDPEGENLDCPTCGPPEPSPPALLGVPAPIDAGDGAP